ncbi:sodium:solute symporter family protein [Candidatus Bandiella euplotis]|uniref:sodium:solute symporter family protein n=1 Tax=Candidatus Bandiella euplotis TaxID=1664265 RepID=UPI002B256F46|nr:hypothetical protein [Candidatus Bandiella woodruffii]
MVDYLLFGRKLTLPLFVTTLVTTWYGDVFGITQIAFKKGIYAVMVYGVGFYLAAVVFMCFFVVKARGMSAFSIPDIIEKTYGKIAAKIVSVMVMVRVLPVSYTIGIGLLLKQLFGWDMDVAMLSGLLFCIGYIGVRGFSGIVYSDAIQFVLMFVSVIMVVVFSFIEYGGFGYLSENLDPSYFSIHGGENLSELLVWFFIAVIATFMSPVFYQRCFAAKSTQVAKYGIFISIICWMFFDFCTITGSMYAKAMTSEAAPHEAYFNYAMNMLPIGFRGVFLSGIAATILSTLDSFLFICSATLVYDLLGPKYTLNYVFKIGALVLIGGVTFFLASHFIDSIDKFYIMMKGYFGVTLAIPLMLTILFGRIANEVQFLSVIVLTILGMLVNDFILDMPVVRSFYVGSMVSLVGFFIFYVINLYCARHKIIGRMAK